MKTLAIIIPFHTAKNNGLMRQLESVNQQMKIDFSEITIQLVGDGIQNWSLEQYSWLTNLDLHFTRYEQNQGAGYARQVGNDQTESHYIMYLDDDDVLQDPLALSAFFTEAARQKHDLIVARYTQQSQSRDGFSYLQSELTDNKSPVAKWFNRRYLDRIGLKWHPNLRIFEDTYFVGLACELTDDIFRLNRSVYLWLWNAESTVRKNDHAFDHQLHEWVHANRLCLDMVQEKKPANLQRDFFGYMGELYFHETVYKPVNWDAYDAEQKHLLTKYRRLWGNENSHSVVTTVAKLLCQAGRLYEGMSLDNLPKFMQHQDALLYQAFEEAQGR
ncbi:MAG: glycosyltransferase family 2 protein [Lactobacillus sp.]|jgi:glycosyltransferase involved in cell wall biosynthesis|nr:MAG: glycosyltransferase family 2 protein [Lactobacillus sp.]